MRVLLKGAGAGGGWRLGREGGGRTVSGMLAESSGSRTLSTSAPFSRRFPLTFRALLTREWKQPGKTRTLAHESPVQRAAAFPSPAPSFCVGEERARLPGWFVCFLEKRFDVAEPPANGATGTREGCSQ